MFFSKTLLAAIVGLSLSMSVSAHATIQPTQQLATAAQRSGVVRGGSCNAAQALKNPIAVGANGEFVAFGKSFNGGTDGATTLKNNAAKVDTTASGKTFNNAAVTEVSGGNAQGGNGNTSKITFKMPAGVKCTGGADKATCLVELTTAGGFGACLAVSQKGGAAPAAGAKTAATPAAAQPAAGGNAAAKPATGNTAAKKGAKKGKGKKKAAKKPAAAATAAKKQNRRHARDFAVEVDA
jgi:hypothetical protein